MYRRTAIEDLHLLWGEISDLQSTTAILEWDQEVVMPAAGGEARAKAVATLAGIKHQKLTAPALRDALARLAEEAADGSVEAATVREARREVDRAARVPEDLARELAEARVLGLGAWRSARETADFALFAPALTRLVDLERRRAAAIAPDGTAYDALLDIFEAGAREAELAPLFTQLRAELAPLVRAVADHPGVDESAALGRFPVAAQRRLGEEVAAAIGFDFRRGRLDDSTHPFCVGFAPNDVRMTWRWQEDDFRPGLFGILHESGHGIYEQGLPEVRHRAPLGKAVSLGVHESQSRLWENHVGRSRGFWRWLWPRYRELFPAAPDVGPEGLWPVFHAVRPSLIRVEADEVTYNLHVAIRFELERRLFSRSLEVDELPAAWDDLYEELLGLRPGDAAAGVLQDIHWAQGMFGYFPTYTLGTMMAAQLYATAERELGDLEAAFAAGDFAPLLAWLGDKIHRHGSRYTAGELVQNATGRPLDAGDLLAYLRDKTARVYGLSAIA